MNTGAGGESIWSLRWCALRAKRSRLRIWLKVTISCAMVTLILRSLGDTLSLTYDTAGNRVSQQASVSSLPVIVRQPFARAIEAGADAVFSVSAASGIPLTYQWYFNEFPIAGADKDSLLLSHVFPTQAGNYSVVVMNYLGAVASNSAKLYVVAERSKFLYWTAASGYFDDPGNWSLDRVPGPSDTAVIDAGSFAFSPISNLLAAQVTISVPYSAPLTYEPALSLSGNWTFNGPFALVTGRRFAVSGGTVNVTGPTTLRGATIVATSGAKVTFSSLSDYLVPPDADVLWAASDPGSELVFLNLATITGSASPGRYFDLMATNGGRISLPSLRVITKPDDGDTLYNSGIRLSATSDGILAAPQLSIFRDEDTHPDSRLIASTGGILAVPSLDQWGVIGVFLDGLTLSLPVSPALHLGLSSNTLHISFESGSGRNYQLEEIGSLSSTQWKSVGDVVTGTGAWLDFDLPIQSSQKFFRVIMIRQ